MYSLLWYTSHSTCNDHVYRCDACIRVHVKSVLWFDYYLSCRWGFFPVQIFLFIAPFRVRFWENVVCLIRFCITQIWE